MISRDRLEELYSIYNRRRWVHPDPLEFVYRYKDREDREIAAFVASSLAYGRVGQILKSVASVLHAMNGSPYRYLTTARPASLRRDFGGFRHRFTDEQELLVMLEGIRRVLKVHGSLEACFLAGFQPDEETVLPALSSFMKEMTSCDGPACNSLLPLPERGSACKRLNLFLRWMVRRDRVDPGGWEVPPSRLIVPLDTHMHRVAVYCGLTQRKSGDLRTAVEVTRAFRKINPEDPVRYDFALTRLGIRRDPDMTDILTGLISPGAGVGR